VLVKGPRQASATSCNLSAPPVDREPGFTRTGATRGAAGSATTLTVADATALSTLSGVQAIAPELTTSKLVINGTQNETARVVGTTPGYTTVFAYQMWAGTFLNQASIDNNLRVAVIGRTTADNLGLTQSSIRLDHHRWRPAVRADRDNAAEGRHTNTDDQV